MNTMKENDTIAALCTPAGKSALAVIRVSGPKVLTITGMLFPSLKLTKLKTHTLHFGLLKDGNQVIDEAVVSIFRSPKSFTGEDVAEISCHGSPYIVNKVMDLLLKNGARTAKPGEFTMRAFANGKFNLMQAEAIGDLIASETETAHTIALKQMRGGFSGDLKNMRQKLIDFASLLELELDFSEEDVQFANRKDLTVQLKMMCMQINALLQSFRLGNVLKNGVSAVIAGRPNAGKSTLLNALLNEQRAIVSEIAGTTRDSIESTLVIDGIAFRLTDTAGIRETTDKLEQLGVERTMRNIKNADIIIYLFDAKATTPKEADDDMRKLVSALLPAGLKPEVKSNLNEEAGEGIVPVIPVANKIDLLPDKPLLGGKTIAVSAKSGKGIEMLKRRLSETVLNGKQIEENTILTNSRHVEALQAALASLYKALEGLETNSTGELIASELRSAMNSIGEITGEITTDDLLQNIFGRFCIGK